MYATNEIPAIGIKRPIEPPIVMVGVEPQRRPQALDLGGGFARIIGVHPAAIIVSAACYLM
jgi:hypothetical protein